MLTKRTTARTAFVGAVALGALVSNQLAAEADLAPFPQDVVSVGSDIAQNAFNFLADGYGALPGYNTAGNRWRFVNFDSSGDANGRSAYIDPTTVTPHTGDLGDGSKTYVLLSDVNKVLNPTISLVAGQPNVVRPSGGNGGITAFANDSKLGLNYVDVARSPNAATTDNATAAGQNIINVQLGFDYDAIATSTTTNSPDTLTIDDVARIYVKSGAVTGVTSASVWGDLTNYAGRTFSGTPDGDAATQSINALFLPASAGMRNIFLTPIKNYLATFDATVASDWNTDTGTGKPTWVAKYINPAVIARTVQQNDPTAITGQATPALKKNTIVPFPRGRYTILKNGFYADPTNANSYNGFGNGDGGTRTALTDVNLIKLLATPDAPTTPSALVSTTASSPFVYRFAYNAFIKQSDYTSATPWQPGSTLNWAKTLFYNPGGATPFVDTQAGKALLVQAGLEPSYAATVVAKPAS